MIKIPQPIREAIVAQAYGELPDEACGLLAGADGVVHAYYPLTNTDHSPEHFSFDPREQFRVLNDARSRGLRLIANYHSHPASPARPSAEDIRLAYDPRITYLIISLAEATPVVKAFHITNGVVTEEEIG